jgi:hypothetical protein
MWCKIKADIVYEIIEGYLEKHLRKDTLINLVQR